MNLANCRPAARSRSDRFAGRQTSTMRTAPTRWPTLWPAPASRAHHSSVADDRRRRAARRRTSALPASVGCTVVIAPPTAAHGLVGRPEQQHEDGRGWSRRGRAPRRRTRRWPRAPNDGVPAGRRSSAGSEDRHRSAERSVAPHRQRQRPPPPGEPPRPGRAPSGAGATTTGLGHSASVAATIATTSSSDGAGETRTRNVSHRANRPRRGWCRLGPSSQSRAGWARRESPGAATRPPGSPPHGGQPK